ncbi:MAG TPA: hypothetical protein VGS57_13435 [Thermoanaerobaculia bacterium]|nr:hypothetical protein [Thermoanaerobaculia bacterium]
MNTTTILIVLLAAVVVLVLALAVWRWSRSRALRRQFGPEYDHTVESAGKRSLAERELLERRHRVEKLELRDLTDEQKRDFGERWRRLQVDFVDRPRQAVEGADKLVTAAMLARGYPEGNFEQRVADASVEHARLAPDYREARQIAERSRRGLATTEELRRSLVCYRNLFQALLGVDEVPPLEATDTGRELRA